jgi:hypothetical protein
MGQGGQIRQYQNGLTLIKMLERQSIQYETIAL